jgi:hypothetical protein
MTRSLLVQFFSLLFAIGLVHGRKCEVCDGDSCCTAPWQGLSASCTNKEGDRTFTLISVPGRPLWLSANASDGRMVSSSLFETSNAGVWVQEFSAQAFFEFNDDWVFANTSRPTLSSRRWGTLTCYPTPERTFCSAGGWANASLSVAPSGTCGANPLATVYWWGEGVGHGIGTLRTCLSRLPNQVRLLR